MNMNYRESQEILEEIKKANKILINCHKSPDADSVASALALRRVLVDMGKQVEVVCPDELTRDCRFLKSSEVVRKIDFEKFDFKKHDLFIFLDTSELRQVAGRGKENILGVKEIRKIVIDHHYTNAGFGDVNLVDLKRSSASEILFGIFEDWGVDITPEIAEDLLTGIIFDTSSLQHPNADIQTAATYTKLMELGADKDKIILNLFKNIGLDQVRLIGEVLRNMQIDREARFVWSAVPYNIQSQYPHSAGVKSMTANLYASSIEGADFGMVMIEEREKYLNISFRAKKGFDISKIAIALGGGGHKEAGATAVTGLSFDEAVQKVLETTRKYAAKS
jgi:phosphoesterase RecJ-like protein